MKEEIEKLIADKIKDLNLYVSDVYTSMDGKIKTLNIELDSDKVIDVERITKATEIINPILDANNICKDVDVLDIHSKSKGDNNNE